MHSHHDSDDDCNSCAHQALADLGPSVEVVSLGSLRSDCSLSSLAKLHKSSRLPLGLPHLHTRSPAYQYASCDTKYTPSSIAHQRTSGTSTNTHPHQAHTHQAHTH